VTPQPAGEIHNDQHTVVAQPVVNKRAASLSLDQPRIPKDRQLLRDVRLWATKSRGEMADARRLVAQALQDSQPHRVAQTPQCPGLVLESRFHFGASLFIQISAFDLTLARPSAAGYRVRNRSRARVYRDLAAATV